MQLTTITFFGGLMFGMMATPVVAAPILDLSQPASADNTTLTPTATTLSAPAPESTNAIDNPIELFQYSHGAQSVHDIINSMDVAADGYSNVGDDGVARSHAANGTVIDFRRLSNSQLNSYAKSLPPSLQQYQEEYVEQFANVSGLDVADNQLWNPSTTPTPPTGPSDAENYVQAMSSNGAFEARAADIDHM
ncbi:hypothetical protein LTR65_008014 [Meristemomyces frigidus]